MNTTNSKLLIMLQSQHPLSNKAQLQKFKSCRRKQQRYRHHIRLHHSSSLCHRKEGGELAEKKSTLWSRKRWGCSSRLSMSDSQDCTGVWGHQGSIFWPTPGRTRALCSLWKKTFALSLYCILCLPSDSKVDIKDEHNRYNK